MDTPAAVSVAPESGSASQVKLAASDWVVVDWAAKSLDDPLPESEAQIVLVEQGLRVTSHQRRGPVHFVFSKELLDEFEIRASIVQPSLAELTEEGVAQPSGFPIRLGFRTAGGDHRIGTALKRNPRLGEAFDITVRASGKLLSVAINDEQPRMLHRHRVLPGHFFLEMVGNNRVYIGDLDVREGLEPDPHLVVAAERAAASATSGQAIPLPGAFPGPPMFVPSFPGMGPAFGDMGMPPALVWREPLVSQDGWAVPRQGNQNLDGAIVQDLRLESRDGGLIVAKTSASGGFWLVKELERADDFTAAWSVSVPSMAELASIAGPTTLLAVGVHSVEDTDDGVIAPAPPPLPSGTRVVRFQVRGVNGRFTLDVDGIPVGGSVTSDRGVLVGLYVRGGIRFSIHDLRVIPAEEKTMAQEAEIRPVDESPAQELAPRIWTDASGTRKIEATFLKLENGMVRFRRMDGTEATSPLSNFSADDQVIIQKLARP